MFPLDEHFMPFLLRIFDPTGFDSVTELLAVFARLTALSYL
jgi:hypothetical protein